MDNLYCDAGHCSSQAKGFSLINGKRMKCCEDHITNFVQKKCEVYKIACFNFVTSPHDAIEFSRREDQVKVIASNLDTLESALNLEFETAVKTIEREKEKITSVVTRCFEEVKKAVEVRKWEQLTRFQELRQNLYFYLVSKENQLVDQLEALTCGLALIPKFFRLAITDESLAIAKRLMGCWRLLEEPFDTVLRYATSREALHQSLQQGLPADPELALEACDYAMCLDLQIEGADSLKSTVERKRSADQLEMESMFLYTLDTTRAKWVAAALLRLGLAAKEELRFEEGLNWLQHAWKLKNRYFQQQEGVEIALELGQLLCLQFGRFAEAEGVLRWSYQKETSSGSESEEGLKLCNGIASVLFHSGRYLETEQMCEWILSTFSQAAYAAEHCWTTLFYHAFASSANDNYEKAEAQVEQWKEKEEKEGKAPTLVKACVLAKHAAKKMKFAEAEKRHKEVQALAENHLSIFAAINHRQVAKLYLNSKRRNLALESFNLAQQLFDITGPASVQNAVNLSDIGVLAFHNGEFSTAEAYYKRALKVYAAIETECIGKATVHYSIGLLYNSQGRFAEAESEYREALKTCRAVAPRSIYAARSHYDLGMLLQTVGKARDAVVELEEAKRIYAENRDSSWSEKDEKRLTQLKELEAQGS